MPLRAQEIAYLACNDRFFLLTVLLRRRDADHPWLYDRCREVEFEPDGRLDLWAREHYKSTIITFAGAIQEILIDPEITIGIFSVTKEVARPFLSQIKDELEGNDVLKGVFPDVLFGEPSKEAPRWSVQDGIVVRRKGNPKEATVEAHGLIEGMPTGRHFRLRIYDDPINEKYTSPDMIKKSTNRIELSTNLGGGERRQQMVGTRYHFGDTYGIQISRGSIIPRVYPATHDGTLKGRPVFLKQEDWEKRVREQRGTVAAQMLQNPLAGEENSFRGEWLRPYWLRPRRMNVYIIGDPSKGRSKSSDRTAIVVIGVDPQRNRYLLDGYCHRMKLSERWTALRQLWTKWSKAVGVQSVEVGWEQYGLITDIEYFDERREAERLDFPSIKELNWARDAATQSKKDRVERLEPYFRNSQFWLPARLWDTGHGGLCRWVQRPGSQIPQSVKEPDVTPEAPFAHLTKAERQAIKAGEAYRIMEPIRRLNEDREPYDLMSIFFEEFVFFPFSPRDDLIDATSRIEDMDAAPPVPYDPADLAVRGHVD